jgi:hypothetical protein
MASGDSVSEHSFQSWCDRFLDRVVLPPMFTSGIDMGGQDFRKIGQISALQGRGIKFGLPDVFLAQNHTGCCWLELKRGTKVTARQEAVHNAMRLAGQRVSVCSTMQEVLRALRHFGFDLHPNAGALADEYEMRVVAKEQAPRTPKAPAKARKPRITTVTIERWRRNGVLV